MSEAVVDYRGMTAVRQRLCAELGGTGAAGASDGFDQLNVTGEASLDGLLDIKILEGYNPQVGDKFDILTYGSVTGNFAEVSGLFGFKDDYFFEVVQSASGISLEVKELFAGDTISFELPELSAQVALGNFLNATYFSSGATSLELDVGIAVDEFVSVGGTFLFERSEGSVKIVAADGSPVDAGTSSYLVSALASDIAGTTGEHTLDGLAVDGDGNIYVSAPEAELIYRIAPDGTTEIFAGNPEASASDNGATGDKLVVSLERQFGLNFNADFSVLYIHDKDNDQVRQVDMVTGIMSTFYDFGAKNAFISAGNTTGVVDMVIADNGDIYMAVFSNASATGGDVYKLAAGETKANQFATNVGNLWGIELHDDHLYLSLPERSGTPGRIDKYDLNGNFVETVVSGVGSVYYAKFDADGRLYFADGADLKRLETDGTITTIAENLGTGIKDIVFFGDDVYVADQDANAVYKLTLTVDSSLAVDVLSIGGSNLAIFAGLNAGEDDAAGFALENGSFVLSLITDQADALARFEAQPT